MRLLFVGDVHLSDRPPSTRREGYADEVLAKLEEVGQVAKDEGVQAVVYAGDIFHSKIPHRTSHELVQRAIDVFRSQKALVVPGNHDYRGANHEELRKSPLGTLSAAKAVTLFGTDDRRGYEVPPPPNFVRLYGIREEDPLEAFSALPSESDTRLVVVAHSAIFPPGQDPPYPHFKAEDVAAQVGAATYVLYGHIHDPHGVYEVDGVTFVNPGSLSRGSLWEADPQRVPQVALVDWTEGVRFIPLRSAKPWDEVFRVEEEYEARDRDLAAAGFAAELAAASIDIFDVERVIAQLRSREDVTTRVRERAVELVEQVDG